MPVILCSNNAQKEEDVYERGVNGQEGSAEC